MKSRKLILIYIISIFAVLICAVFIIKFIIPRIPRGDASLPVLMYHHIAEESSEGTVVTTARFEEQIKALSEKGYESVTIAQVIGYVEEKNDLPEKPVLITFDDGYSSNLELAAPIIEKYDMCATIFVIGKDEGKTIDIHSGNPYYPPRFSYEDALPWIEKGVIDLQSHSFDMHRPGFYDNNYDGRKGMLRLDGESYEDYLAAITGDILAFTERREGRVPSELTALAYPFGYYSEELDSILEGLGVKVTFTIEEKLNPLIRGDKSCLRMMGRFNITDELSGKRLLLWI